jgi:hypothetical protein
MDYGKFTSVEEVEAYVNRVLRAVIRVLDVPWIKSGNAFHLDTDRVRILWEMARKRVPNNTITEPLEPLYPIPILLLVLLLP